MPWRRRRDPDTIDSPQDLLGERLSAYLDGELTPEERAEVEAELEASADAREVLDDLRLVREALTSLDIVRAPRSFALEAPPARAPGGLFSRLELAMRASAAVAAFVFVVVVAGGASLSVPSASTPGPAMDARALAVPGVERMETLDADGPGPADPAPAVAPDEAPPADAEDPGDAGALAMPEAGEAEAAAEARDDREQVGPTPDPAGTPMAVTDSPGGAAAALGVVAVLLGALSWLVARARRSTATG